MDKPIHVGMVKHMLPGCPPLFPLPLTGLELVVEERQRQEMPGNSTAGLDHGEQQQQQQLAASWLEPPPPSGSDPVGCILGLDDDALSLPPSFEDCFLYLEDAFALSSEALLQQPRDASSHLLPCDPSGAPSQGDTPTFRSGPLSSFHLQEQLPPQPVYAPSVPACLARGPALAAAANLAAPDTLAARERGTQQGTSSMDTSTSVREGAGASAQAPSRRKRGRPRIYDTQPPAAAPTATPTAPGPDGGGAEGGACAGPGPKRGRGPKPKYVFSTQQEALGARRERNRKAALDSYYRKKEQTQTLEAERQRLQQENAALGALLAGMAASGGWAWRACCCRHGGALH